MKKHIHRIRIFFAILLFLVATTVGYRMLVENDKLSRTPYTDIQFVKFMENLIQEEIIVHQNGSVVFHNERFRQKYPSSARANRIRRHLPGVVVVNDALHFDPVAASVANPMAASGRHAALRGRIFDREGNLLAGPDQNGSKRVYPLGAAGFQTVGYGGGIYLKTGIERALDPYLQAGGKRPWWRYVWRGMGPSGSDVYLAIDAAVQQRAHDALEGRRGAIVVIKPQTGDVLALASSPSFDPNTPPGLAWIAAEKDAARPFANRATRERYPPGSLFKIVVAAAGLENDVAPVMAIPKADTVLGISDANTLGETGFKQALSVSSNVYFARLGVMLNEIMAEQARGFGFSSGFDLAAGIPGAHMGVLPSPAFTWLGGDVDGGRSFVRSDYLQNPRLVAQGSLGQNVVLATPMQMALVASAVANRGKLMEPRLVLNAAGHKPAPRAFGQVVREDTASLLTDAMVEMMETGTGRRLQRLYAIDGKHVLESRENATPVTVAGKTGTAEVADKASHAWFVGFAPAEDPRAVVCVFIENGGWGAAAAGPAGMQVLAAALDAVSK